MFNNKKEITLLIFLLSTGLCFTQLKAQAQANANTDSGLSKIAEIFLGKWRGEIPAENGEKIISDLSFEWTLNKSFLKVTNTITAGGKKSIFAETVYGWQPVLSQVVFWSFDSNGTINEGIASLVGDVLKHEWRAFESNGRIRDLRSNIKLLSPNTLIFTLMEGKGSQREVRYSRVKQ